jgi:hypothetical protein
MTSKQSLLLLFAIVMTPIAFEVIGVQASLYKLRQLCAIQGPLVIHDHERFREWTIKLTHLLSSLICEIRNPLSRERG